jgi:hypothetical protein
MKIVNIHKTIAPDDLLHLLWEKLNPRFREQRQSDLSFVSENKDGVIEISHPQLYEGFLYQIEVKGHELHITRSEHYVDDVNSLTIESILNELIAELAADGEVTFVLEG